MDKECKLRYQVFEQTTDKKNNSYIAASSAYKDGENANKNSYSAIHWHEICSVMSSDVSYVM